MENNNPLPIVPSVEQLSANQFVLRSTKYRAFQSYKTLIAVITYNQGDHEITLDRNKWDYSSTTSKYRNRFLNMTTAETKEAIKQGKIKLADLN